MPRVGLTREGVIRAAAELADDEGLEAVSTAALARRVGVRPASLYSHVAGNAELREGLAALALDELADRAAAALAGRSGRDALVAFAGAYRGYAREHPGRYAATRLRLPADSPAVAAGRRNAELTRALLLGYDLGEPETTHAIRLLGSTLHGFTSLELSGAFEHSEPSSDASWSRVLDVLDQALRGWTQPRNIEVR